MPESQARDKGRPVAVYAILALGIGTLLVLLLIIYFNSDERNQPNQPTCINLTANDAIEAIYREEVEILTLNYDSAGDPDSGSRYGPVLAKIDFANGQCGNLPQGIDHLDEIYQVLGVVEFYNDTTERAQIEIRKEDSAWLADQLFWSPTPLPTETPVPTETVESTETVAATATATATPTDEPTSASEAASPEASPAADF